MTRPAASTASTTRVANGCTIPEIIAHTVSYLEGNEGALQRCIRVNTIFFAEAARLLYKRVQLTSAYDAQVPAKTQVPTHFNQFSASCLPTYAVFVEEFEINGLSWSALSEDMSRQLRDALETAIGSYCKLSRLIYTPYMLDTTLATAVIGRAVNSPALTAISLKCNVLTESLVALMCQLKTVRTVHLINPISLLLVALPNWFNTLVSPLEELYLEEDCGAVTPGVLSSLESFGKDLKAFTLGVSYSLKHQNVFSFLSHCPHLLELKISYNFQIEPTPKIKLSNSLRTLHIEYPPHILQRTLSVNQLCRFIRRLSDNSSDLIILRAIKDPHSDDPNIIDGQGPLANFDGLVLHLSQRHARTLRVLDLPMCFIGPEIFARLLRSCGGGDGTRSGVEEVLDVGGVRVINGGLNLRILRVAVRYESFTSLESIIPSGFKVQDLRLNVVHTKRRRGVILHDRALRLLQSSANKLRCITVNGHGWEGSWETSWGETPPAVIFTVTKVKYVPAK